MAYTSLILRRSEACTPKKHGHRPFPGWQCIFYKLLTWNRLIGHLARCCWAVYFGWRHNFCIRKCIVKRGRVIHRTYYTWRQRSGCDVAAVGNRVWARHLHRYRITCTYLEEENISLVMAAHTFTSEDSSQGRANVRTPLHVRKYAHDVKNRIYAPRHVNMRTQALQVGRRFTTKHSCGTLGIEYILVYYRSEYIVV